MMSTSLYSIPKIIHFIWAGGDRAFPKDNNNIEESNHHIVHEWIKANPEFYTVLWIDKEGLPDRIFNEYLHRGYSYITGIDDLIYKSNTNNKVSTNVQKNIFLADIQTVFHHGGNFLPQDDLDFIKNIIFYEMRWRFHPNYGASSDVLRYLILLVYGGVYFDSDVYPGKKKLSEHRCFKNTLQSHFMARHTNDAFICSPQHYYWIDILKKCMRNYQKSNFDAENNFNYHWNTYYRTGPGIQNASWFHKQSLQKSYFYQPNGSGHKNWAKISITDESVYDNCIKKAVSSLLFEIKYMKIYRLNYYIDDVSLSLREYIFKQIRKLIRLGITSSKWGLFIQQLSVKYKKKKYDRKDSYLQRIGIRKDKNFASFCEDVTCFLEMNEVNPQVIKRVIHKIKMRSPIMTAKLITHFKQYQQDFLKSVGASFYSYEPGIGGLLISDILLEENLLELVLPLSLEKMDYDKYHEYELAYQELIDKCNQLVISLSSSKNRALVELKPVSNASLINHHEVQHLLRVLSADTNLVLKNELKNQLNKLASAEDGDIKNAIYRQRLVSRRVT